MTTRLVELCQYKTHNRRLFAKIEGENPSGSMKDRFVHYAIPRMETSGQLKPNMTIVEASSGNTGIALAKASKMYNHDVVICMSTHASQKKKEIIRSYGATINEYDTSYNSEADIESAGDLAMRNGWCYFNQFNNQYHIEAYRETLGKETIEQLRTKFPDIKIDTIVAGVGTGASLIGLAEELKIGHNPKLKAYSIRPNKKDTLLEGLHPGHLRPDFPIWINRPKGYEETILIDDEKKAIKYSKELCENGLSVGYSSGAVLNAVLDNIKQKGNYLLLFADNADRYNF